MKFNFKKIASVLASAVMLTSTVGFAAAANYPAPFSASGGAVVYGSAAYVTDATAAFKVEKSVKASTTTINVATTGETSALFTGSSKINANDSISQVKSTLTSTELPTVLKKGSFSGNVDATYTQTIDFGPTTNLNSPRLIFAKQPTSSDDPGYGLSLSTSTSNFIYNTTVTFNKAINLTDSNSKNQEITLFGQKYTVGSGTDSTNLILFKSATKINFDSTGTTSAEATINGKTYTIELVTASTTTATVSVTSEDGTQEQKEVTEGYSKKINGITIAVNTADSNNQKYTASVVAGADKVTLTSGSAVTTGDEGTQVDGTLVTMTSNCTSLTKIVVSVAATDSDNDAIMPGESLIDPVYGSFKLDFAAGMNIGSTNSSSREDIVVRSSGDDKMQIHMTNNRGNEISFPFIKNWTTGTKPMMLQSGDDGKNITVIEGGTIFKNEYVMVGNEDQGYLLRLSTITNSSSNYADDKVKFTDVFDTTQTFESTITSEGGGTVTIGGKVYTIVYYANDAGTTDDWNVTLDYPDSTGTTKVVYPTMQTSKGAKIGFYKQNLTINMSATSGLLIPNGNGYTTVTFTRANTSSSNWALSAPTACNLFANSTIGGCNITAGSFIYNVNASGTLNGQGNNLSTINIALPDGDLLTINPALIIIEEKDDASAYQGAIVSFEGIGTSTDGIGINDYERTWSSDSQWDNIALASNSNKAQDADLFGTIALTDSTDSDQKTLTISYPDEQIYAQLYGAAEGAVITGGSSDSTTGALTAIEDKDLASVEDKDLIVVGGSCVNKAAAKILGSENPICGADFTALTQVGASQYIIKTVKSPYNDAKIAVLVAGYEAVDTINAVDTLLNDKPKTDVDTSQVYPIASTTTV